MGSGSRSMSPPKPSKNAIRPSPTGSPAALWADEGPTEIIKEPETRRISQKRLVAEVKDIYSRLDLIERKCVEADNNQNSQSDSASKLNCNQWQALIALHRGLLQEAREFYLVSQHSRAWPAQWGLAAKYAMPTRMNNAMTISSRQAVDLALRSSQENQSIERSGFDSTEIRDRRVCGVINGTGIRAIPDTGANESFISASFLKKLKRRQPAGPGMEIEELETGNGATVQLASGKSVTCTGTASIPWIFEGESHVYRLACRVLPKCSQDLILGDTFLRSTKTLTDFKHRISTTLRSLGKKIFRLNYMGHDKRQLRGYLNGDHVAALPDSGSDIMAISADYARRRGFHVNHRRGDQVMVQFADGSTAWTDGVVRNLEWEFGRTGSKVASDFYVMENLTVDVLLSGDFVFDHDVFGQHDNSFSHYDGLLHVLRLCNIRLIGRYSKDVKSEEEGSMDVTSPDAFSPLMVQRELARRDAIRDIIAGLPAAEQAPVQQAEDERQQQWKQWRAEHALRWARAAAPSPLPAPDTTSPAQNSHQPPTANLGRTGRFGRAGRWAWRNCKEVWIPLMPLRERVVEESVVVVVV